MPAKIAVLAKQVIDPEMPMAAFQIDSNAQAGGYAAQHTAGGQRV